MEYGKQRFDERENAVGAGRYARRGAYKGARRNASNERRAYQPKAAPPSLPLSRAELLDAGARVGAADESLRRLIEFKSECFEAAMRPLIIWRAENALESDLAFDASESMQSDGAELGNTEINALEDRNELNFLLEQFADDARGEQVFFAEHSDDEQNVTANRLADIHRNIKQMLNESVNEAEESFFLAEEPAPALAVLPTDEYRFCLERAPAELREKEAQFQLLSAEILAQRRLRFQLRYGYLNGLFNQLVLDIIGSDQQKRVAELSENGFDQSNVIIYCKNPYKIFSMFLQGNIVQKLWRYKQSDGVERGPFIAYDMDIWNAQNAVFGAETVVSLAESPFLPFKCFAERSPLAESLVGDFLAKTERQTQFRPHCVRRKEPPKRVNFKKPTRFQRPHETRYERRNPIVDELAEVEKARKAKDLETFPPISEESAAASIRVPISSAWTDD